jgi:hypothetical protein
VLKKPKAALEISQKPSTNIIKTALKKFRHVFEDKDGDPRGNVY